MEERWDGDDPWDENDGEELEAEIMRADRPFGGDSRGTTAEEEITDVSISVRDRVPGATDHEDADPSAPRM
jgi:hypothetical protein